MSTLSSAERPYPYVTGRPPERRGAEPRECRTRRGSAGRRAGRRGDGPGAAAELGPRARLWPSLAAVYRAQLSRARVARIPLLFVATFQSIGIMILMRGVVDGGGEARAVVAGASVLVVAFVALNLLAQYFGQLRASGGLDHYATLPVPPAAVVLGAAGAYASFTVPGTVVTAVFGCVLFGLPLAHLWVLVAVIPLAGAALAGLGAALGLLAPRPELATAAGTARHVRRAAARGAARRTGCPRRCGSRGTCCPRPTASRRSHVPSGRIPTGPSCSVTSPCAGAWAWSRWPSPPGPIAGRPSGDAPHRRAWHDVRVTAPLTPPPPPHEPSSHRSVAGPRRPGTRLPPKRRYGQDGPGMKTELREAVVVTVAVAVLGALLGVLWWWLAPHVPLVGDVDEQGSWVVYLKDTEGEQAVGVDGTFTLLALAFGFVSALVGVPAGGGGAGCRWWWGWPSEGCWGPCSRGGWGCGSGRRRTCSPTRRPWARASRSPRR